MANKQKKQYQDAFSQDENLMEEYNVDENVEEEADDVEEELSFGDNSYHKLDELGDPDEWN